jgi:hypothetical protein
LVKLEDVPSGLVMVTVFAPDEPAGAVQVAVVLLANTEVQEPEPIVIAAIELKFAPTSVTVLPPANGPPAGETEDKTGGLLYVYALPRVAVCVSGFVTTRLYVPAVLAEVTATMLVGETEDIEALVPPILTVAPETKLVPEMVMEVPPAAVPEVGVTETRVGGEEAPV